MPGCVETPILVTVVVTLVVSTLQLLLLVFTFDFITFGGSWLRTENIFLVFLCLSAPALLREYKSPQTSPRRSACQARFLGSLLLLSVDVDAMHCQKSLQNPTTTLDFSDRKYLDDYELRLEQTESGIRGEQ